MTAEQAQATGKIVSKKSSGECSGWDLKAQPTGSDSVGLYVSKKVGLALIASPAGVKTPQGIGIGSTDAELRKAYPKLEESASGNLFIAVPGNPEAVYNFQLSNGKLDGLSLALKNQDCAN